MNLGIFIEIFIQTTWMQSKIPTQTCKDHKIDLGSVFHCHVSWTLSIKRIHRVELHHAKIAPIRPKLKTLTINIGMCKG